jgi:hypothetical protein
LFTQVELFLFSKEAGKLIFLHVDSIS